ncbi:MAG: lipoprotein insertase outer membrane protein LolB [Nevskiaceae bacterium]
MKHSARTEQAWTARRAQLAQIDRFTLQARVSSGGLFGVKGNLNWHQTPEAFDMRVAGPFGIGAATITGRGREVEIRTAKRSFVTQDPEGDLKARLGWTFPVSHLRYWVLGQPAPGSAAEFEIDGDGRIVAIEQDGWTLAFSEYQDAGAFELPRKFEVANEELRLKVVVDTWSDLPALK